MKQKIIFMDVDGTLLSYENELPDSAVKAIRMARANGHKVYICTGRSRAEIYDYIWEIGLDGMIGGNGSYVESDGKVIFHQVISKEQTAHIVNWLKERGLEFYLESNSGLFASDNFEVRGEPVIREYSSKKGKENAEKFTVRDVFPKMIFGGELYRDDLNKVSFVLESYQDYLDAVQEFPDLKAGTWGGAGETALFGELALKEIDKGYAIDVLLSHLNAERKDTFAFGDAKVDIPMLACCNVGVAVASGGEEIKAMADYVTDSVDEDGIYNAFVHFELI